MNSNINPNTTILGVNFKKRPKKSQALIDEAKWYAIYTRSRFEKKLYCALRKAGLDGFLPLIKVKRAWSDRLKTVEVPLLPSYVFVKIPKSQISRLYYLPGFVRLVASEGSPCVIRQKEISLLEQIITHGYQAQPTTSCGLGDRVMIVRGPLKGWEGIVEEKRGNNRVLFQFEGIQQTLSVEVSSGDLERV